MPPQPVPNNPPPEKSWEDEWFDKEGVKEDAEKEAIRSRARVLRYASAKQKADEEEEVKKKTPVKKPWYKE